jgi:hypothetical protein
VTCALCGKDIGDYGLRHQEQIAIDRHQRMGYCAQRCAAQRDGLLALIESFKGKRVWTEDVEVAVKKVMG